MQLLPKKGTKNPQNVAAIENKSENEISLGFFESLKLVKRLLLYGFNSFRLLFIGFFSILILEAVFPFIASWVNAKVFDAIIAAVSQKDTITDLKPLLLLIIVYLLAMFLNRISGSLSWVLEYNYTERFGLFFHKLVANFLSNLDFEYFENPKISNKIQRLQEQYKYRPVSFQRNFMYIFGAFVSLVLGLGILTKLNVLYAFILFIGVVPSAIINSISGKKQWRLYRDSTQSLKDSKRTLSHLVSDSSLKEVHVFGIKNYLSSRAFGISENYTLTELKMFNKYSLFRYVAVIFAVAMYGLVFFFLIKKTLVGAITVGSLTFYLSAANSFSSSITNILARYTNFVENGRYVKEIFDVLDLPKKVIPGKKVLEKTAHAPTLEFKNVSFKYPDTKTYVLKNLNLTINPSDHIAFVGHNGAGKTTLVKLLLRFYDVTAGEILVNGTNIKELDIDSYYQMIGVLFQDYNFYHFDAKTNIGVGDVSKLEYLDLIETAAKKSGADEFIKDYENKYDQILDKSFEAGLTPSEGQKQRISLARTFFKDAPILILDEPTSAIDPKAEYEIFDTLFKFAQKKTVLIISHRFSTVRNADRIIVFEKGKIIEDGSHQELMQIADGVYKHAFELQRKGYE